MARRNDRSGGDDEEELGPTDEKEELISTDEKKEHDEEVILKIPPLTVIYWCEKMTARLSARPSLTSSHKLWALATASRPLFSSLSS
jgi:hypothetical protein